MSLTRPTSRFIHFNLTLLLLLSFSLFVLSSQPRIDDDDDFEGFEELLAIDKAEEEGGGNPKGQIGGQEKTSSDPEVLRRAQRIVFELSNENAKKVIDGNEYVLLLGYAPWCHRSAELMPHFAEAATALKEMGSSLVLAKLDAERHTKAATLLGIKGFPTLLLFVNGSAQSYTGGFTGEEMVIWARKRTGVPIIRLSSITAAEEFLKKHQMFAIGLFEKFEGHDYEEFVKAATANNEIQFVETSNVEVASVLFPDIGTRNRFLGLVKSDPEKYEIFEDSFEEGKMLKFLEYHNFPLVTVLNELNSIKVHSSPMKLQVYIFAEVEEFKKLLMLLQDVARKFKSKIMFIYADSADDNLAKPFLTLFGLESESEKPIVTAFDNIIGGKYLLESDLTHSNLEEFCLGLFNGTLSPFYKSEPIKDNKGIIQAVVGKTFDKLVLNSDKNVLLEVHTPWCIDCEAVSKRIEKLAKHFKGLNNMIFARIDASSNEHPKLQINEFPALLFYPSVDKSNPIKLSKKSSLKELIAFINANVKAEENKGMPTSEETTKDEL